MICNVNVANIQYKPHNGFGVMPSCKTGAVHTIAQQWVNFMIAVRGVPALDQTRLAKSELQTAIDSIQFTESSVHSELSTIAKQVKRMDPERAKVVMAVQLKRSRYLRQQMIMLENKRISLQQHLDTLDTSELNQQVISSVKKTSSALKSMGLDAEQQQLDALFIDMEDQLHGMKSIQQSLSSPLDESDYDSATLEQELDMLLCADDDGYVYTNSKKASNNIAIPTHLPAPVPQDTASEPSVESKSILAVIAPAASTDDASAATQDEVCETPASNGMR